MKRTKIISAVISAVTALTMLTAPASAYMLTVESPESTVESDKSSWMFGLKADADSPFTDMSKIEVVLAVEGDTEQYTEDLANSTMASTGEWFGGFAGCIGVGAKIYLEDGSSEWWHQFDFTNLDETDASGTKAGVKKLNSTAYLVTADLTGLKVAGSESNPAIKIADWGSSSEDYFLAVKELFVYGADGSLALYSDGNGNYDTTGENAFDESKYAEEETPAETTVTEETAAEEETTTTTTTSATTTTAAQAEAETTAAGDEAPAETTAAQTAAQTTAPQPSADLGARDSSLLIVGIVAGVVIVAAIVGLVIIMTKKK